MTSFKDNWIIYEYFNIIWYENDMAKLNFLNKMALNSILLYFYKSSKLFCLQLNYFKSSFHKNLNYFRKLFQENYTINSGMPTY